MQTLVNVILLLAGIGFPLAMFFGAMWYLHRNDLPDRIEPPDTIDYDRW